MRGAGKVKEADGRTFDNAKRWIADIGRDGIGVVDNFNVGGGVGDVKTDVV